MANNTVKFDIKAAIDTRGLDEFQSQLGELRSTAEPLDRVLGQAVKSIKEWAEASRLSERNTAAAASAINALTSAMTAGGSEWKKGTQAANDLNRTLRETVNAANAAKAALAAPARTTGIAGQQIADMRKGLQDLTIGSTQYLSLLQQITEREALVGRRTGRAGVVAANQAFEGALLTRGYGAPDRLQAMPDTTAALRQRLSELSQEFPNVIRGSERYIQIATEMRTIESQLARDLTGTTQALRQRSAATQAKIDAVRAYNEQAIRERVINGEMSVAERRRTAFGDVPQAMRTESGAFIAPPYRSSGYTGMGSMYAQPIGPEISPQSAAALNQQYQKLADALPLVARGGERYLQISREMRQIERDLARDMSRSTDETNALAAARKRLADATSLSRSSRGSGFAAWSSSVNDRLDTQNAIDQYRQQQGLPVGFRSGAAQFTQGQNTAQLGPAAPTELLGSIDGIRIADSTAKIQTLGRTYDQVAQQIRDTAQAAGGSTRALQAERQAWEQLQASVAPATREYKQAGREMQRLDRQLGTSTRGERFLESAGAISAGAFFGGPEGLAGGLLGMAVGGPGAALGGASIGAQLGIVRKSIGDAATYSAEIGKLRIALKGVVGDTEEYNKALGVVSSVSRSLNIPVQEATQGFTRLAAAVVGAGGNVGDAEVVFKGVTSAIKATGGSSQDAQSAVLALSQVFSKGKVSAEELQGQLGERLPGAVTLFAQATGRTLPQLSKDLEQGTVGLNDLMRFTELLSSKYAANALTIARSTEDSGARQALALSNLREEFGKTFMPLGAALQDGASSWAEYTASVLSNINKIIQRYEILKGVLNIGGTALLGATPVIGPLIAGMSVGGQRNQSPQGRLANTGSTTMYSDAQGNVYDTATGKLLLSGGRANTNFADPKSDKSDEKARKATEREERKRQEEASRQQRLELQLNNDRVRLDEQRAENAIRLEDRIFQHRQELMRREREQQLQLDQLRQQTLIAGLSPEGRAAVGPIQELVQRLQGVDQGRQALKDQLAAAQQELKSAKLRAENAQRFGAMYQTEERFAPAVSSGIAVSGIIAKTGNTGDSTGPHLDARWADKRPITAADVDRYLRVNGRPPSSFGITSPYGPRSLFGRSFHSGVDFGTPSGSGISLVNGAKLLRNLGNTGAGGYAIEIMTDQGPMRLLHLQAGTAASGSSAPTTTTLANGREIRTPGAASAALRAAGSAGEVETAQALVDSLQKQIEQLTKFDPKIIDQSVQLSIAQITQSLNDQQQALQDNYQEWQIRNRLQLENVKPELIEFEVRKTKALNDQERAIKGITVNLEANRAVLEKAFEAQGKNPAEEYSNLVNSVTTAIKDRTANVIAIQRDMAQAATDPLIAWQSKMNDLGRSLEVFNDKQKLAISLSDQFTSNLAGGFSSAASSIINGNSSIQQSFADLFNNIAKMFIDTIARVLADQATSFLLNLFKPAVSSIAPGPVAVANGIVPRAGFMGPGFATGGVSSGPTSGYPVTLHGTEAIVPLPNGRAIPVEMKGSGGTNVVVNVNMTTGETNVSSSEGDGRLLGTAISDAVQAELIRQQRPGGILYRR